MWPLQEGLARRSRPSLMAFLIWGFLLLLQGLQGMQGPKVSSEAWMGTLAPTCCRFTAWLVLQILASRQSESPTVGPGPALHLPMAWPFPSPCQRPQSWYSPTHTQPLRSLPPPSSPLKHTSVSQLPTAWTQSPGFGVYYVTSCSLLSN